MCGYFSGHHRTSNHKCNVVGCTATAERAPTSDAMHIALGMHRVIFGHRPRGGVAADGGSKEEEMADMQNMEATGDAGDVMMSEKGIGTTAATETETEARALATNNWSDLVQRCKAIQVDNCGAGDRSRMQGGRLVCPRATGRKCRFWD